MLHVERALCQNELQVFEYSLPINGQARFYETRLAPLGEDRVLAVVRDVTERQQAIDQLQALSQRLLAAHEDERRAIAHELHDEVGQILTGVSLTLAQITPLPNEAAMTRLNLAQTLIQDLMVRVRNLALDLRPAVLDDMGILPALATLTKRYTAQTHIGVGIQAQGLERRFAPEVETATYRIIQEALTNAARHAQVESVALKLWIEGHLLCVQIEDQGAGFDPANVSADKATYGLDGMREHAMPDENRKRLQRPLNCHTSSVLPGQVDTQYGAEAQPVRFHFIAESQWRGSFLADIAVWLI